MTSVQLPNRAIGLDERPFVIAEMSGNHNQSLERALEIVDAAADAGAHALKIQTYTADTITLDADGPEFRIQDPGSLWAGETLYSLYQKAHTPWEWHKPIFERARQRGLIAFSTPFDDSAVDFLESLDVPCYKIASFENVHIPLIRRAASTGKPLIISTGMASVGELAEAVDAARGAGCQELLLLKCTSAYPAAVENSNLRTIPDMSARFACPVGISDHTLGTTVAAASVALGAVAVEKHFTLSRADRGVDSAFSLEPLEMRALVQETERVWLALGEVSYGPSEVEKQSVQLRRSLYVAKDMRAGDALDEENLRVVRPGNGLAPKYYDELVGRRIVRDAPKGTPVTWELLA